MQLPGANMKGEMASGILHKVIKDYGYFLMGIKKGVNKKQGCL